MNTADLLRKYADILSEAPIGVATAPGAAPTMGAAPATTTPTGAPGAAPTMGAATDPATQQKMLAQQALDRQNQKKQIQDAIRQKQEELADLNKQLAAIK